MYYLFNGRIIELNIFAPPPHTHPPTLTDRTRFVGQRSLSFFHIDPSFQPPRNGRLGKNQVLGCTNESRGHSGKGRKKEKKRKEKKKLKKDKGRKEREKKKKGREKKPPPFLPRNVAFSNWVDFFSFSFFFRGYISIPGG